MALNLQPFASEHVQPAARLLAARHTRDREREPLLPAGFESPDATQPLVDGLFQRPDTEGIAALRDGDVVGFLLATALLPNPKHFLALLYPPRSSSIAYHGHAIASDEDASLYRELYAAMAGAWVSRGFFDHFIHVASEDADAREAWDSLGFGRDATCAIREVAAPVAGAESASNVSIHQATPEDISVIQALADALGEHHATSPIFAPNLKEPQAGSREMSLGLLSNPASAHFVAYRDGTPLGMQTFMPPGFLSPALTPEETTYLFQGIVDAEARSGGVGRALLAHSMAWAQEQGHRWCALHFAAPNLLGARFWLGNGFRPVEHRLRRHIDERIAWASA